MSSRTARISGKLRSRRRPGGYLTQERMGGANVPRIPSVSRLRLMKLSEDIAIDNLITPASSAQRIQNTTATPTHVPHNQNSMKNNENPPRNPQLEEGEILPGTEHEALAARSSNMAELEQQMQIVRYRMRRTRAPRSPQTAGGYQPIGGKSYWCWVCSQIFFTRTEHKDHLAREHDMDVEYGKWMRDGSMVRSYECTECGAQFKWPSSLMNHYNQSHAPQYNLPFKCEVCGWGFALLGNLQKHEKAVHGPDRPNDFVCSECDSGFRSKKEFTKHLHRVHQVPNEKRRHFCPVCNGTFQNKSDYVRHVGREHPDCPNFVCYKCGELFDDGPEFMKHRCAKPARSRRIAPRERAMDGKLPQPNNPEYASQPFYPYKCLTCNQLFQYARVYDRHMQDRHWGTWEPPEEQNLEQFEAELSEDEDEFGDCEGCRKGFKTNASYKRHIKKHHSERGTATSIVGGSFTTAKFQCPNCGDFFARFDDLNGHRTRMGHWGSVPAHMLIQERQDQALDDNEEDTEEDADVEPDEFEQVDDDTMMDDEYAYPIDDEPGPSSGLTGLPPDSALARSLLGFSAIDEEAVFL